MKRPVFLALVFCWASFVLTGCWLWPKPAPPYPGDVQTTTPEEASGLSRRVIDLETRMSAIESSIIDIREQLDKLAPGSPASGQQEQLPTKPAEQVTPTSEDMPECVVEAVEIAFYSVPYDRNEDGIDDGITAYVRPTDRDGETLKRAGRVKLELIDLAADPRQTLMQWEFPPREALKHWSSIPRGYLFNLLWQGGEPPRTEEVYLKVTFTDRRGRASTDERKFHLTLSKPEKK